VRLKIERRSPTRRQGALSDMSTKTPVIDPPSPCDTLEIWEHHLAQVLRLSDMDPLKRQETEDDPERRRMDPFLLVAFWVAVGFADARPA
jgi:hypothetical protein